MGIDYVSSCTVIVRESVNQNVVLVTAQQFQLCKINHASDSSVDDPLISGIQGQLKKSHQRRAIL